MKQIEKEEICPFCIDNLARFHKKKILKLTLHWLVTKNQWPYQNTRVHLLAIYREHAENISEISPEAGKELFEIIRWAEEEYKITSGALAMRFGDISGNGATVSHIHAQILSAKITNRSDPKYIPVRVRVG